jgi:hypothetical protein
MAIKCSTAFVDPPITITRRIAFSNAAFVIISRGFKSICNKFNIAGPDANYSARFSSKSAGDDDEYGRDIPIDVWQTERLAAETKQTNATAHFFRNIK